MHLPRHHAQAVMDINRDIVEVRGQLNELELELQSVLDRQTKLFQLLHTLEDEKRGLLDWGRAPYRWMKLQGNRPK